MSNPDLRAPARAEKITDSNTGGHMREIKCSHARMSREQRPSWRWLVSSHPRGRAWSARGPGRGYWLSHTVSRMLKRDEPYHDVADWHRRRNDEAHTRRLVAQLEHLGHTVIINPAA
jgi:hypothetical protein